MKQEAIGRSNLQYILQGSDGAKNERVHERAHRVLYYLLYLLYVLYCREAMESRTNEFTKELTNYLYEHFLEFARRYSIYLLY